MTTFKALWMMHRIKKVCGVGGFLQYPPPDKLASMRDILGQERFDKEYPIGKEHIEINTNGNQTIIHLKNLCRQSGKTYFIQQVINTFKNDKCAYFSPKISNYMRRNIMNNNCEYFAIDDIFHKKSYSLGKNFDHFFFDEFKIGLPDWKHVGKAIKYIESDIITRRVNINKPSIALFIH